MMLKGNFEEGVNSYIYKLINNLWKNTREGNFNTVFFNTKDAQLFSSYINYYLDKVSSEASIFREVIDNREFSNPYYPFLDFVKDSIKLKTKNEVKDFVKQSGIYYFQQPVFTSYFLGEPTYRKEKVIFGELNYEKNMMYQSLLNCYYLLSKNNPIILVIENLNFAKHSTLEFIKYILKTTKKNRILFIFSLDKEYQFTSKEKQKQWDECINFVQINNSIIDFYNFNITRKSNCNQSLIENKLTMEEVIDLTSDSYNFFALHEAKDYITKVYNQNVINNVYLDSEYYSKMLNLLADVYLDLEENDIALMHYHDLLNTSKKKNNIKDICYCYQKMALIQWKKGNVIIGERLTRQSLHLALELKDEILIFYSNFYLIMIEDRRKKENFGELKKVYYKCIETAKKYNMKNALSYCYTNPFLLDILNENERKKFYNLGIELAQKYGNKDRLSIVYHAIGISLVKEEKYKEALIYHKKSEALRLEMDNKIEISYIFNGIGFNYYILGDYDNAYTYYCKSLEVSKISKNYNQIAITLWNLANNYFMTFKHELSIECLKKALSLFNIIEVDSIYYHTFFGLYSLIGINYCKLGRLPEAYEYMIKIKNIKESWCINEDKFWVNIFNAFLYKSEGQYDKSTFYFELAKSHTSTLKYMLPRFYYEYALMKKEEHEYDYANDLFNTALEYCKSLNYSSYYELISKELKSEDIININLTDRMYDLTWISDYIKQESIINNLHQKINEINSLNILQEIIGREKCRTELIKNVMSLMHDTFYIESIFLYIKENEEWNLTYCSNDKVNIDKNTILDLVNDLAKEQKIIVVSDVNRDNKYVQFGKDILSITNIPLYDNCKLVGDILCINRKEKMDFNIDDIKILSITAKQLISGLKKIKNDQEIAKKNKELYEANESERMKTEFLCNLSHEFRTPLNVMLGILQLLALNTDAGINSKYFEMMKQNCYRLLRLINNLIDISKFDAGFYKTNFKNYNIVTLIEDITLSVVTYAEMKGIVLEFDTDIEEKIMPCDADQMERVILNLLSNSIKFTDAGGKISVNFYDKGDKILIVVKDTGIGIPQDKLKMIFKRFGQVDKSLARNHEGSGIGLSLVKSIVENWGGDISVDSNYGEGSTFKIQIPVKYNQKGKNFEDEDTHTLRSVERTKVEFSDIYF